MKNFVFLSLSLAAVCLGAFAASADFPNRPNAWFYQDLCVINICNLTDQDLNEIIQGNHPEKAVEFSAQTRLPLSFFLKGDFVNWVETEGTFGKIEIKQTFYARCVEQKLMLSSDLINWKPFLEFITGMVSATLSRQDGQPSIVVDAEINQRY